MMPMAIRGLAGALLCAATTSALRGQTTVPRFEGQWTGTLVNLPGRPGAPVVTVERDVGPWPAADSTCANLKTVYREGGVVRGEKAYRLCRGTGAEDLYVDEGDGVRLGARLLGGVLVSPFKYDSTLLVSSMRLRGDTLEEEILTVRDKPAGQGVVVLAARSIQRLQFVRVTAARGTQPSRAPRGGR
jgi:hypothetical protein